MNNPFQELADRLTSIESLLTDLAKTATHTPPHPEAELLDVGQAATFLRLTPQTVYDKIHNDTLPYVKQGNRVYFFKDELILWLKSGRQPTREALTVKTQEAITTTRVGRHRRGGGKPA